MQYIKVGDKFETMYSGFVTISTIPNVRGLEDLCTFEYENGKTRYGSIKNICDAVNKGRMRKVSSKSDCNHIFRTYEGFTDTFDYCTICNEKRK